MSEGKNGRTNVHDKERSRRPTVQTNALVQQVDQSFDLIDNYLFGRTTIFQIVMEKLRYYNYM